MTETKGTGRPLHVCTQVFNRWDAIRALVASCDMSTRRPDGIWIVDHGYDSRRLLEAVRGLTAIPISVVTLEDPGCAHNGNWFMRNVPDDRVCCGDDVYFRPECLERMAATEGDMVIPAFGDPAQHEMLNPFACTLIRRSCVDRVGYFDEKISPGYLYFDDTDYARRMDLAGVKQVVAEGAIAVHLNGGSLSHHGQTPEQWADHHRRFPIAQANYTHKWGGGPFNETLTEPRAL